MDGVARDRPTVVVEGAVAVFDVSCLEDSLVEGSRIGDGDHGDAVCWRNVSVATVEREETYDCETVVENEETLVVECKVLRMMCHRLERCS